MTVSITITAEERKTLLEEARLDIVRRVLTEDAEALRLLSTTQVYGLLDCDRKTLEALGIPRVTLVGGRVYRYKLSDVSAWIESRRA